MIGSMPVTNVYFLVGNIVMKTSNNYHYCRHSHWPDTAETGSDNVKGLLRSQHQPESKL